MAAMEDELLTTRAAADYLGIGWAAFRRRVDRGLYLGVRKGSERLYSRAELDGGTPTVTDELTSAEAVDYLRTKHDLPLSLGAFMNLASEGRLPSIKKGWIRLYRPADLDVFAATPRPPSKPRRLTGYWARKRRADAAVSNARRRARKTDS